MARPRKPPTTERKIAVFIEDELEIFVNYLRQEVELRGSAVDVLGALVLAARNIPPTVVRELVELYNREAESHIE